MLKVSAKIARSFKADFRTCMKESLQYAIKLWHKDTLPGHFKEGADIKYGYAARGDTPTKNGRRKGYAEKKRRKKLPPLVWSGLTRKLATGGITVSGTSKSASGSIDVPFYVAQRQNGKPDMVAEITATTPREEQDMADFIADQTVKRMTFLQGVEDTLDQDWRADISAA